MKYILWPPFATLLVLAMLAAGTLRFVFIPTWHFRMPTIREAFTFHGEYIFENYSWKELLKDILIYKPYEEQEEEE